MCVLAMLPMAFSDVRVLLTQVESYCLAAKQEAACARQVVFALAEQAFVTVKAQSPVSLAAGPVSVPTPCSSPARSEPANRPTPLMVFPYCLGFPSCVLPCGCSATD